MRRLHIDALSLYRVSQDILPILASKSFGNKPTFNIIHSNIDPC